jgi:hypothetical protein
MSAGVDGVAGKPFGHKSDKSGQILDIASMLRLVPLRLAPTRRPGISKYCRTLEKLDTA